MKRVPIHNKIYEIRNLKVMLDFDLAELYEVETKNLNLAVKRNLKRFPEDFMFRLTDEEWKLMRSQFVTASKSALRLQFATSKRGGTRYLPYAFTEQGLAMLSGILKSDKAIDVNIAIMRAFVHLRQFALSHKELTDKLRIMEKENNTKFKDVYEALNYLLKKDKQVIEQKKRVRIGFKK